ncbi:DUF1214 domain-containing protein [Agromyces sp. SYSU T00194]|uniref:DUF1214 domain-containing protein n=1 Tax=Agromyces chitinivorans TaxID=3158560 RepID=UPI0033969809
MGTHVNVDNFAVAETARMFHDLQRDAGGVNRLLHHREPAPIDQQTVIRMNRDTLYSFAIVDVSAGATLTLPDAGGRYVSAMVVNEGHYIPVVFHGAGSHHIDAEVAGSPHCFVALRILVDPNDPDDVAAVAALQDGVALEAASDAPFPDPDFDTASLDATRNALLQLAAGIGGFERTFGRPDEVDPVRHLIGTAAGWGGLPSTEASYVGVTPDEGTGTFALRMADVPVDAFWSISVYDAKGFFEPNASGRYTVNSVTGVPDDDGAITVHFVPDDAVRDLPNAIPTPEGWNFIVRLYQPRPEYFAGAWTVPDLTPVLR